MRNVYPSHKLEAGLPEKLVLYCGRHDYGTRVPQVRRVLNGTNSNFNPEQGLNGTFYGTVTKQ
jgi:hypothetical protein